mgnify:CR=1 FL=1
MRKDNASTLDHEDRWSGLLNLALQGLHATYGRGEKRLPHTMMWDGTDAEPVGSNVRYALISLLGLGQSQALDLDNSDLIADLWSRVAANRRAIENSAGDLGLALWAQALTGNRDLFSMSQSLQVFREHRDSLDSVNLAWVMLGADHTLINKTDVAAEELVQLAREDLLELYNPASKLFYRHAKKGPFASVSRQVPCFANQIYPVTALAVHARRTGSAEAARVGRAVADNLCSLQGPLGQWWWLYDASGGAVVDGYPVFSVHQDGMAPMALLEATRAGGRSYQGEIERGLSWIFGGNELETNLILADQGLVLRDIHKKGVGRVRRAMRSAAWCWGFRGEGRRVHEPDDFTVNRECRPYHLGWILYAASLMSATRSKQGTLFSIVCHAMFISLSSAECIQAAISEFGNFFHG